MSMQIQRIDHLTLRTEKLEETCAFYEQVAGLTKGWRPGFKFPGYWLYQGDTPLVHMAPSSKDPELVRYLGEHVGGPVRGALDHLALRCTGLPAFEQRLKKLGQSYTARTVPDLQEHQVFVIDPNELKVEFIFHASEPASWTVDEAGVALNTVTPKEK